MSYRPILVIGYGNTLRCDDGVGPFLAGEVEKLQIPGVRTLAVHQLTLEMAADLSEARAVIFVDATTREECADVEVTPVRAGNADTSVTHSAHPGSLLTFSEMLYGSRPPAWLVTVRASCLDYGEELSSEGGRRGVIALAKIRQLITVAQAEK